MRRFTIPSLSSSLYSTLTDSGRLRSVVKSSRFPVRLEWFSCCEISEWAGMRSELPRDGWRFEASVQWPWSQFSETLVHWDLVPSLESPSCFFPDSSECLATTGRDPFNAAVVTSFNLFNRLLYARARRKTYRPFLSSDLREHPSVASMERSRGQSGMSSNDRQSIPIHETGLPVVSSSSGASEHVWWTLILGLFAPSSSPELHVISDSVPQEMRSPEVSFLESFSEFGWSGLEPKSCVQSRQDASNSINPTMPPLLRLVSPSLTSAGFSASPPARFCSDEINISTISASLIGGESVRHPWLNDGLNAPRLVANGLVTTRHR